MIDTQLASYATPRQLEYLEAVEKYGSNNKAAQALGVGRRVVDKAMETLKLRAAQQGYSPEHDMRKPVPAGFTVKGVSTYYDEEGKARGQWVKSTADAAQREQMLRDAFEAMAEDLPRVKPTRAPVTQEHLATLYTLTDSHVGALCWHREGGHDWDLEIAERTLVGCFDQMVNASPAAHTGIVAQLGDFLHSDGLVPVTPTSHHVLDQDGRFSKVVSVAVRVLRRVIALALAKHERVIVLMAEGNHDMASSIWLRVMFRALFENEPRVEVIDSELPYYVHRHGKTMLGFHHGHLKKNDGLPMLFAAQFPQVWGATEKRYIHTGHRHHVEEKEHSGVTVVQHPTLAARDAYAARGGWMAERQVRAITYHSLHGEVARNTVVPEMLA
ncbi:hypothetical protein WG922_21680 [Ramlibacter sp. AN1015]|uniref:hypothetical protein n=1 Tax=Ramlibacter sp. AN1015 TaxID=3133428 RepID=UPI0030BB8599